MNFVFFFMAANFNLIAPFYDSLSHLVYGNNLTEAKKAFFSVIPSNAHILLMGGGTGNILNDLLGKKPGAMIDFVEPSSAMIKIAQKNLEKKFQPRVTFICGDHHSIPAGVTYDVVTSFFVMDCFRQQEALGFARAITTPLVENGPWLFADFFYTKNSFRRGLIWFMYRFFRIVSNITASKLPDYGSIFHQLGFTLNEEKTYLAGLIHSRVYRRSGVAF